MQVTRGNIEDAEFELMDAHVTLNLTDGQAVKGIWVRRGYAYGSPGNVIVVVDVAGSAVAIPVDMIQTAERTEWKDR